MRHTAHGTLKAFCPYCGSGDVEAYIRNAYFGGTYIDYYCNDCRSRLSADELIDAQEAERVR